MAGWPRIPALPALGAAGTAPRCCPRLRVQLPGAGGRAGTRSVPALGAAAAPCWRPFASSCHNPPVVREALGGMVMWQLPARGGHGGLAAEGTWCGLAPWGGRQDLGFLCREVWGGPARSSPVSSGMWCGAGEGLGEPGLWLAQWCSPRRSWAGCGEPPVSAGAGVWEGGGGPGTPEPVHGVSLPPCRYHARRFCSVQAACGVLPRPWAPPVLPSLSWSRAGGTAVLGACEQCPCLPQPQGASTAPTPGRAPLVHLLTPPLMPCPPHVPADGTPLSELSWSSSLAVVAVSFSGLFTFIFLMLACLCCKKGDIGFKVSAGGGRGGQGGCSPPARGQAAVHQCRMCPSSGRCRSGELSPRASPRAQHHGRPYPDPAPHSAGMPQGSASLRAVS